jgi:putative membrane protein
MANERTFLAWIRTSIGVMAFGFVVERFSLFMRQVSFLLGQERETTYFKPHGYSSLLGIFLVAFGILLGVLAYIRYKKVQKEINAGSYTPSSVLDLLLTLTVMITGIFLLFFLIRSL